ncbi:MAG TPA: nitroreductase family protein, partial [bacterium]|nr:nitroreductase family protein [bacterium]
MKAPETPLAEIIRARSSWRSFDGRPLEPGDRARLEEFIAALGLGPFGGRVRLQLVEASAGAIAELKKLGTYGMVKGARTFLAGAIKQGPMDMEDYGYVLERVILEATALGLGTCWLGASFNRSAFARAVALAEGETLPAVSPVGYVAASRTAVDAVTRFFARAKKRKPSRELFFDGDFATPLSAEAAGPYAEAVEMVRLGPSASNRQPWRLLRDDRGAFHLFLRRTPGYNSKLINVAGGDLQRLDMGIACCHFELAARELGMAGKWERLAPPALELPPRTT